MLLVLKNGKVPCSSEARVKQMSQSILGHTISIMKFRQVLEMHRKFKTFFSIEQCFEKILNFSKYFFSILFQFNFVVSKHCSYGSFIYPMVHSYECIWGTMFWINKIGTIFWNHACKTLWCFGIHHCSWKKQCFEFSAKMAYRWNINNLI